MPAPCMGDGRLPWPGAVVAGLQPGFPPNAHDKAGLNHCANASGPLVYFRAPRRLSSICTHPDSEPPGARHRPGHAARRTGRYRPACWPGRGPWRGPVRRPGCRPGRRLGRRTVFRSGHRLGCRPLGGPGLGLDRGRPRDWMFRTRRAVDGWAVTRWIPVRWTVPIVAPIPGIIVSETDVNRAVVADIAAARG